MIESKPIEDKIEIVRLLFEHDFRCLPKVIAILRKRSIIVGIGALRSYAERLKTQLKQHEPAAEWIVRKALGDAGSAETRVR